MSNAMAEITSRAAPAVVSVSGRRRRPASGVIWSDEGLIVTANHVVERDENIIVSTAHGEEHTAELVGRDPNTDLALLRIPAAGHHVATWATIQDLATGQLILALGRPGGSIQATLGVISSIEGPWRHRGGGHFDAYIQTDVTMYPGFSGGPLLTATGTFAGINSSALARGVSVTIPASTVQKTVNALLTHGHIPRAFLGIGVQPVQLQSELSAERAQETGLMVMSIEAGGPAASAGLLQGDILLRIDEQPLRTVDDLQNWLSETNADIQFSLELLRSGALRTIEATVGSR